MRLVVQRVSRAKVTVDGKVTGEIGAGLMILVGVGKEDTSATAVAMADAREDWSDWDVTLADGLHSIPWEEAPAKRVAELKAKYQAKRGTKKTTRAKKK